MRTGQPSRTAIGAAAHRALHQILEDGAIFRDPFASRILDEPTEASLKTLADDVSLRPLRLFIAARSRFSEDALARSVAAGVRQVVILGAGLDTFSLRNCFSRLGVIVFEVDHPATQSWKRARMKAAGIPQPRSLIFTPIDFERESLSHELAKAGFRWDEPAFFQWLGVVPYLTRETIMSTLTLIGQIPSGAVVFDYAEPLENYPPERRANVEAVAASTAERGEPWLSFFEPRDLKDLLLEAGFSGVEDLGLAEISERLYGNLAEGITIGPGPHIVRACR